MHSVFIKNSVGQVYPPSKLQQSTFFPRSDKVPRKIKYRQNRVGCDLDGITQVSIQ